MIQNNFNQISKITFNWSQIEVDCKHLAKILKQNNQTFKGMVMVSRGGLAVGALLSRLLDITLLELTCIASYEADNTQKSLEIITQPNLAIADEGENWLVVDDLIDSGYTYQAVHNMLKKSTFACLYNKSSDISLLKDIIFVKNYPSNSWLEFPWETLIDN